jgi:hypothetical protein
MEVFKSREMLNLFIRDSHHSNISVIMTSQSFATDVKHARMCIAQMTYHVVFRYTSVHATMGDFTFVLYSLPAQVKSVQHLSRMFTSSSYTLNSILKWVQKEFPGPGENYVLVSLHPRSMKHEDLLKIRTAIFPRKTPAGTVEIMPVCFVLE